LDAAKYRSECDCCGGEPDIASCGIVAPRAEEEWARRAEAMETGRRQQRQESVIHREIIRLQACSRENVLGVRFVRRGQGDRRARRGPRWWIVEFWDGVGVGWRREPSDWGRASEKLPD
jgi:hypothetical protein